MNDVVQASDEFDFSRYQPGDAIVIPMAEIQRRGQAASIMLIAAICNAAARAGLNWKTHRDEDRDELRVQFS